MPTKTASWARGSSIQSSGFTISNETFNQIVDLIEDNEASIERVKAGMNTIVSLMVYITRSEAMKQSFGPVAPQRRSNPAFAFRIPVQRITGAYYAGWYVRRIRNGVWAVGNSSKEAYLIETGLFQRARRPILKNSANEMLRFLDRTRALQLFGDSILAPRRNSKGQFRSFDNRARNVNLGLTAPDMPNRGAGNPNIVGPSGVLP